MRKYRRQGGFTLIELMVAASTGLILMVALGGILSDTVRTAEALTSRIAVNRHAREIFDLLSFGSYQPNLDNTPGSYGSQINFGYVFGLRGRNGLTANPSTLWSYPSAFMVRDVDQTPRRYRFALPHNGNPPDGPPTEAVLAESIDDVSVTCTDLDLPLHGCWPGSTLTGVRGFLAYDPHAEPPAGPLGVGEIAFRLADTRRLGAVRSFRTDVTEVYWTAFTALQQQVTY